MADIIQVWGPRTASVERKVALEQLQQHPQFPKGAIIADFREEKGQWLAELKVPQKKQAGPPPFPPKDDAPVDDAESGPPSDEKEPPSDEPVEPEEKEDKPKDEGKKDEGKKGVEATLEELVPLIHAMAEKMGVGAPGDDSPVPGDDLGDVPPPPGPPPGAGAPPKGPAGAGLRGPSKLKPGEVPNRPGVTPVGAPAFSSTQEPTVPDDHPWKGLIGKVATMTVSEETDMNLKEAREELAKLGEPYGYKVRRLREDTDGGQRVIRAIMSRR